MSLHLEKLSFTYQLGTPFERTALSGLNLFINDGEFVGITGESGSGKSTLLEILSGLLFPFSGKLRLDTEIINSGRRKSLERLRQKVGLVFQFPEEQIFEKQVYDEIAFGPRNLGLSHSEVDERVREAMASMGLGFENYRLRRCHILSSGEKRRLAIAAILAMKPQVLLLDEPAVGLDYEGRQALLQCLSYLNREKRISIIMVSHHYQQLLASCPRIILLDKGQLILDAASSSWLEYLDFLMQKGWKLTASQELVYRLMQKGWEFSSSPRSPEETARAVVDFIRRSRPGRG
ncbi:MAG: ATP-binding cassette domain-containing protein [Syntrophomonas sp.]|uniref:ATP-binding cassette domain-containing protein n=1 Tax=Syntrophomonas sp. TaxID=2053627 RepID=UPI00262CB12D|nr:ATP-binding cassette domain-containing protein [Syntrophomonas sp.]MDD2509624.1 ATP-binding cassette domain-containing protein [Syntrophomonas sp.]MDD3879766.1 ATP-binding cassette domain-containing protein [Syntrophomonas sp.]MDD4626271.1 ATP-binding cassette domain-containing protein [Syntrophomonas sp.]